MIPEHVLAAATILVKRQPESEIPAAVKTIREFGGLSQSKLGRRTLTQRSAVCNWETGQNLPPVGKVSTIFRACGFPEELIASLCSVSEANHRFVSDVQNVDTLDDLEFDYFNSTRYQVLTKLGDMAREGDTTSIKLYNEWMIRNRAVMAARASNAIPVGDSAESLRNLALSTVKGRRRIKIEAQSVVGDTATDEATPVSDTKQTIPESDPST